MSKKAGAAVSSSKPVAETFQEELKVINERGKEFKGEQRDFYRSIVQRLENNVQILNDLRDEHSSLRQKLGELVKEKNSRLKNVNLAGDLKHMSHEINLLKKRNDRIKHQKEKSIERQRELEVVLANYKNAESSGHPEEKRIQDLKNQLGRANIKNQEAAHMIKQYQRIIYYMDRQKMRWNPILAQKQEVINQKNRDISELNYIARDSKHSKSLAVSEYYRTEEQCMQAKKKRDAILDVKKEQAKSNNAKQIQDLDMEPKNSKPQQSLGSSPSVLRNKMNKAAREKKEERFRQVSSVYEAIRDRFGTTDPESIQKFLIDREENTKTLNKQIEDLKSACTKLENDANHLKSALEEAEYASSKGVGTNRLLSEGNKILLSKQENLRDVKKEISTLENHQKSVMGGIYQLSEVLSLVQSPEDEVPQDPSELLNYFADKINKTKENLNDDDFDLTAVVNIPALVAQIAKNEKGFDMEKAESDRHVRRNFAEYKRTQKEKVGDIQSRVLDRAQVKMNAIKAVQMHQQHKKGKNI